MSTPPRIERTRQAEMTPERPRCTELRTVGRAAAMWWRAILWIVVAASAGLVACGSEQEISVSDEAEHEVVYRTEDGRVLTFADLRDHAGTFDLALLDPTDVPLRAKELHEEGRRLGSAGELEAAIAKFNEASQLCPEWAYPRYDLAHTYLLQDEDAKALEAYRQVDALVPRGFFTTKTAVWTLEREAAGAIPRGTYRAFLTHEWAEDNERRIQILEEVLSQAPGYPPAHQKLAYFLEDPEQMRWHLERGLEGDPDAETRGMLLLNKAARLDSSVEAERILCELALDPETTQLVEHFAKVNLRLRLESR